MPEDSSETNKTLEESIHHLEQAVRLAPGNARYSALLGEAWLLRGDAEAALAPLQNSLQGDVHPRAACLMALALLRLEQYEDAERFASAAIAETGAFHRAFFIRAAVRQCLGRDEDAIQDLRDAHQLSPGATNYRLRLASLLLARADTSSPEDAPGRLLEAHRLLAIEHPVRSEETWRYALGSTLLALGEAEAALAELTDLTWPSPADVALGSARAYLILGQVEEAAACAGQARVQPELTEAADRILDRLRDDSAAERVDGETQARGLGIASRTEMLTRLEPVATEMFSMSDEAGALLSSEQESPALPLTDTGQGSGASSQIARTEAFEFPGPEERP